MDELTRRARAARDGGRVALRPFLGASPPEGWRVVPQRIGPDEADVVTRDVAIRVGGDLVEQRGDAAAR